MLTWPMLPQQTQPGSVTVYPLNAFLVVKSDSNQWSQFFAWQWDSLGHTWCSSAHKPLPPSPILGARREQLYYVSPILLYSRAATTNALPFYLHTKYSISNLLLLLIQFKANLCPGWDPNPTLQKCSCSCTTASTAGLFLALLGRWRISIFSLFANLVRLQEAWNADTAEVKAARNKVSRKMA